MSPGEFWLCECDHPLYEHSRRKPPGAPEDEYVGCRRPGCDCEKFRAQDGSGWPNRPAKEKA